MCVSCCGLLLCAWFFACFSRRAAIHCYVHEFFVLFIHIAAICVFLFSFYAMRNGFLLVLINMLPIVARCKFFYLFSFSFFFVFLLLCAWCFDRFSRQTSIKWCVCVCACFFDFHAMYIGFLTDLADMVETIDLN